MKTYKKLLAPTLRLNVLHETESAASGNCDYSRHHNNYFHAEFRTPMHTCNSMLHFVFLHKISVKSFKTN